MNLVIGKGNLDTCLFPKSVKGDSLPYCFLTDKSSKEVQLVVRNVFIEIRTGDFLQCTAQSLKQFDETMKEQLSVLLNVDKWSVFKPKKKTWLAKKSKSSQPSPHSN